MKQITLTGLLVLLLSATQAQEYKVERGTLSFGLHMACPQNDFRDTEYDDGWGFNWSYLSRGYPYKSPLNVQFGARMDFAAMRSKSFDVELATPVPDNGTYAVRNNMYGLFAVARINLDNRTPVTPYVDLLVGHRNYGTHSTTTANNPDLNPDYESVSYQNRVVHTKRLHYGAGAGLLYKLGRSTYFEAGATFTFGGEGAVMPLKDVTQAAGSNEVAFNYTTSATDILLINAGFRFQLFKRYRVTPPNVTTPNTTTSPRNTRYRDTRTPNDTRRNPDPVIRDRNTNDTPTEEKKKAPIEIKPDGPKKGGDVGH
jgi:hypothetical protein